MGPGGRSKNNPSGTFYIWKPDPGIYLHAARDMGYSVADCVVVDDGPVGVEAGVKAGIRTLFYNRFNEPCDFPGAVSFDSMSELPGHIRRMRGQSKL
jgi:beta-phosphoglucomutase-like phosphatase (HAD superfamily)